MAEGQPFNPNVPFVEGTPYLNWSREITTPTPNRSGEILGKGIGEAFKQAGTGLKEGVSGINAAIETGLKRDVYEQGDALMNQEINNLYKVYAGIEDKPSEIKNLPAGIKTVTDARDNGKLSNTHHDGLLDMKAKELRARYPGYRQEVDEYFRAATGRGSTANQLYESIRGDIDAAVAARKEGRNKVMGELWSASMAGVKDAPTWMKMYQSGQLDEIGVASKLAGAFQFKYQNAQDEATLHHFEAQNAELKVKADQASKSLSYQSFHLQQDEMNNYTVTVGGGRYTLQQLEDGIQNGSIPKPTVDQAVQLRQIFDARKQYLQNQIRENMFKPDVKGQSSGSYLGEERYKKELEDSFTNWDNFSQFLLDGKFSLAKAAEIITKAQADETRLQNQNDPKYGETMRQLAAMKDLPPAAQNVLIGSVIGNQSLTDGLKARLLSSTTGLAAPIHDEVTGGYKTTLAEELEKARKDRLPPTAIKTLLDSVTLIGNTKVPVQTRLNLIESVYGVNSAGVVGKFSNQPNPDGTTDMNEVFKTLTNRKNTDEIWKIGKEYPKVWDNYQTKAENEWHTKSLQDLKDLDELANAPDFNVKFNTDTNEFDLDIKPGTKGTETTQFVESVTKEPRQSRAKAIVRRLNDGLRSMSNIYDHIEGQEVSVSLIKLLHSTMDAGVAEVISNKLLDALENAYRTKAGG